jgi:protein TonB
MFFRMFFGLPGAAIITALLFLAMGWMIRQETPPVEPGETPDISILAKLKPTPPRPKFDPPPREDVEKPPETKFDFPKSKDPGGVIDIDPLPGPQKGEGPITLPTVLTPTVRIPPAYPENCAVKGVEGVVVVEFDVTPDGAVASPRIISSSNSCFDRTVLRSIVNWKYSPQFDDDGRPILRRNVRETLVFELSE